MHALFDLHHLASIVRRGRVCVLSGAGISTPSGIPDYRGPAARPDRRPPVKYKTFADQEASRVKYWSRSAAGWPWISSRKPNLAHEAVAQLEAMGIVESVITQNVDGLHQRAGSRSVLELHGTLSEVVCLLCGAVESREDFQDRIPALNPGWTATVEGFAPDGDADLSADSGDGFVVPACTVCGDVLKPNVVFFGENVPQNRVAQAYDRVDAASTLLVAGSSLTVLSGFRFVKHAYENGLAIAIVNRGPTRGDGLADVRIDDPLESVLPHLVRLLSME